MRAGSLRHRLTIQAPTLTPDGQGGNVRTWSTIAEVWGLVTPLSGRELLAAAQLAAELSTTVLIRFRSDISVLHRLVVGTRTLAIGSIQDPTGRRAELQLLCSEIAA